MKNKEIVFNDIVFTFTVSNSSKARYSAVLTMHIVDPETGKLMKEAVKNQIPLVTEEVVTKVISKSYYFDNDIVSDTDIKKAALQCASKLYSKYENKLLRKLRIKPEVSKINTNQMYIRYIEEFMKTQNRASAATQKEKRRVLKNACMELMDKPVVKITNNDIDRLFKNTKYVKKKNLIRDFFEYCRNKSAYSGINPVLNYLEYNNLRKLKTSRKAYPKELSHIPPKSEEKLHELMLKHIEDNEIMALILIKCFGCSLNDTLSMKWSAIEEYDGQIIVKGQKNNTGSFHTFDRPILLEGDFLVKERIKYLHNNTNKEKNLDKERVVPIRRSKDMKETRLRGRLTTYIRNMLIEAGLKPDEISSVAPNTRTPGGTGVALLRKHYEYVLSERCGLNLDTPEGKYMRGLVPGDTTNLFYRSLSDRVSGIPYLLTITRRDDFFLSRNYEAPETTIMQERDNHFTYKIPSPGPGRKLSIIIPKVFLQSGTTIKIKSRYGVTGEITYSDYLDSNEVAERVIY